MTRVGVMTLAHRRHGHLHAQHRSLARGSHLPDDYLVVAMDDDAIEEQDHHGLRRRVLKLPGHGAGLPLAAARNQGAASLLEAGADVVVGLDVDCLAGPELVACYADIVTREPTVLWSGPVTYLDPPPPEGYDLAALATLDDPHSARPAPDPGTVLRGADPDLFWSLSFALSSAAWTRIGGFCEQYVGYGGEDTDFARTAAKAGIGCGWVGGARGYHQFHPVSCPPVEHLDDILRNAATFRQRWGEWPMRGWLADFERLGLISCAPDGWRRVADRADGRDEHN